MPILPIPLTRGANQAIEEIGLGAYGAAAMDVYFDSNGNLARRPSLSYFAFPGSVVSPVDGLYWWDRQSKVIVVAGGRCFPITASDGTVGTEITGATFATGAPVYWADFGTALYAANGGRIIKIGTGTSMAVLADADAPTAVSHIAVLDDYLLALSTGTQQMHYSDASAPDDWSGSWVTALARPDLLKAIGSQNDIIELMGTEVTEGWRNDGSTPFVKEPQYTVNRGTGAAHSLYFVEDSWYFLDQNRKVVRLNGRTPEVVSLTLNKYIQGLTTVSDAVGQRAEIEGRPQYMLLFPTEGKSVALDVYSKQWTEFGSWNSGTSTYLRFEGQRFCVVPPWNLVLVGDRTASYVYKFNTGNATSDPYVPRSLIRTPHIHWEHPELWKLSSRLDFYAKKTNMAITTGNMTMTVRWRDDGSTTWNTAQTLTLTRVSTTEYHGYINRMGMYHTRQYEIVMADGSPMVLSRVMETFRVLGARE